MSKPVQAVPLRRGDQMVDVLLPRKYQDVIDRVREQMAIRDAALPALIRTAQVMDGGADAVPALLGASKDKTLRDLPMANYMRDAMKAFAGRLRHVPTLRTDPPNTGSTSDDSDSKRKAAEKKARIVTHYHDDEMGALAESMPLVARWVPGAGYAVWTIDPVRINGYPYPRPTLHSPMDTMLSPVARTSRPEDVGFISRVPVRELVRLYPEHADRLISRAYASNGAVLLDMRRPGEGLAVVRYYDRHGTWWIVPDKALLLDYIPNRLTSSPAFVDFTNYNYSRLRGEFDDMIGPLISYARLHILSELAVRRDVLAPTNIFGSRPISGPYKVSGLRAINEFDANTRVDIPRATVQFQAWQELDRIERQLRIEGTSPSQDSGESPMSFVTGRGLNALTERVERAVGEYQTVFKSGLQRLDSRLLEYDERTWPGIEKPMAGVREGAAFEETYKPRTHIKGNYRTRREYGAMASVDEAVRLNGLAIMDASRWVSKTWIRGQLSDLGIPVSQLEEQIENEEWNGMFRTVLAAHATNPESPEHIPALQLVVEAMPDGPFRKMAEKWLTARGEEPSAEEQALMAQQQQIATPPPDAATVLSRLTAGGKAAGGSQVVGRIAG